jgi:hypothetical protein
MPYQKAAIDRTNPNCEQHDYCPRVRKVNPDGGVTMVGTVPK